MRTGPQPVRTPGQAATCSGPAIFPVSSAATATAGPECTTSTQCSFYASNPNFKLPKSLQWNMDVERAITNLLTLDLAYIGIHGYDEANMVDLNEPAVGTGWDTSAIAGACLASVGTFTSSCTPDAAAITAARPYNTPVSLFQVHCSDGKSIPFQLRRAVINSECPQLPRRKLPRLLYL